MPILFNGFGICNYVADGFYERTSDLIVFRSEIGKQIANLSGNVSRGVMLMMPILKPCATTE